MIDVHRLAGELGVSAEVILRTAAELDGDGTTRSALPDELAGRVRTRLRTSQGGFAGVGGSPIFSRGSQQSAPSTPPDRRIAAAFPGLDRDDHPRQPAQWPDRATGDSALSDNDRSRRADATIQQQDVLAFQLAADAAASLVDEEWRAAGLGRHDRHIIEQCVRNGLSPQDVRRRVDGQTVASRLKNGESISSVRSRMTHG